MNKNQEAFFLLVRAGLWEKVNENDDLNENLFESLDWGEVQRSAEEQSVVGLVAAGVERLSACGIPLMDKLTLLGKCQLIEQRNVAMNCFIADLVQKLQNDGIYSLLVKGQGVAQCYEKPLWRSSGDIDLFLDLDNYQKAKNLLIPLAVQVDREDLKKLHQSMTIDSWIVELHGTMNTVISRRINRALSVVQEDEFQNRLVRVWNNNGVDVYLPSPDNDIIIVFTHFINHFYGEGVGLRQICDWCRLLWTYRDTIDGGLLKRRLRDMGLMTEWKAFGSFAVDYLGMHEEAMPLYSPETKWKRKADRICSFVMEVGNMGHNRDSSYFSKYPYVIRKVMSLGRRCGDLIHHARIFPMDSIRFFPKIVINGLNAALKGEG